MSRFRPPGKAVIADGNGRDEIETQEGEVRKVVPRQRFTGEMGMDEAEAGQSLRRHAYAVEGGYHDLMVVPGDDIFDDPFSRDEDAHLTVEITGDLRERPGAFRRNNKGRGYFPPVYILETFQVAGPKARGIAVNTFYGITSLYRVGDEPSGQELNGLLPLSETPYTRDR